ncbi:hypothetical protein MNV_1190004 [Candidatus Methanoperedens nitroreducens]|uniref:Uncharacterized protein n=1 Tax=Candidatus Methanoperedens nitratireducens TaxID=1392998 RepID=A0A284VJH2_9EURY|nr:hypothetical protein MNV_1190004 [Candidatus Methanoperedens nitroreducens]
MHQRSEKSNYTKKRNQGLEKLNYSSYL